MTYCLGVLLPGGLMLASDSRSRAGMDQVALLSFDATMDSNLSVDAPIDLLRYTADSFSICNFATLERNDPYWMALRTRYANGLASLVARLPPPPGGV